MSKTISTALLTDIRSNVTTLCTCVLITRKDGKPYRLTSHDTDVVVDGFTYSASIPFLVSAIDGGSQLSIDNTLLTLFADGTTFVLSQFADGLFDHAEVEIFDINYETPANGKMTLRRGWFGKVDRNEQNLIKVTVTGLLKILDFSTGRKYQPTCDADFGDKRCRVAVRHEQIRSPYNYNYLGDWVINYDPLLMNAIPLTNGSFDTSTVDEASTIPGWTKSPGAAVFVNTSCLSPTYGLISSTLPPAVGTRALYGSQDGGPVDSGYESYVYQDVDLLSVSGLTTGLIDDGQITLAMFGLMAQSIYLLDPIRFRLDLSDESGNFIGSFDSRWQFLDAIESWRERAVICPVYPGARSARLYIFFRKEEGNLANTAADDIRLYWWNHTIGTPYENAIHRATRLVNLSVGEAFRPKNSSWEANGTVANALNPTITAWTPSGWWKVGNTIGDPGNTLATVTEGSYFLAGGDDSSGVQNTYSITQTTPLTQVVGLNAARALLGKYVGRIDCDVGFAGLGRSKATIKLDWLNSSNALVDQVLLMNDQDYGGVFGVWQTNSKTFSIPTTATQMRITLQAKSPIGSGRALVGFDRLQMFFYDAERPVKTDLLAAVPLAGTDMNASVGTLTLDNVIIWKAMPAYTLYDQVASVVDRKTFLGTTISGIDGSYETGTIWWISGKNAGLKNVIRVWNSTTKSIKMYFRQPYPIAPGDRFIYIRSCQRRFTEDCSLVFQNQINFRGFPKLPGKLRNATAAENAAG